MPPSTNRYEALERDVICPECRTVFKVRGIGAHRRAKHPDTFKRGPHAEYYARKRAEAKLANAETPPEGGVSDE